MATEGTAVEIIRRRHSEHAANSEERTKSSSICPDHFSCSKLMKLVSSLLLHRSPHYGSYDLIALSSNATADGLNNGRRIGRQKNEPQWAGIGVSRGGFDHSKSNILAFSISDDDLKAATPCRRSKSGRRCKRSGSNRRSLDTDDGARGNGYNGVLLKRVVFMSADNLPFSVAARSIDEIDSRIDGSCGGLAEEVFTLADIKDPKVGNVIFCEMF